MALFHLFLATALLTALSKSAFAFSEKPTKHCWLLGLANDNFDWLSSVSWLSGCQGLTAACLFNQGLAHVWITIIIWTPFLQLWTCLSSSQLQLLKYMKNGSFVTSVCQSSSLPSLLETEWNGMCFPGFPGCCCPAGPSGSHKASPVGGWPCWPSSVHWPGWPLPSFWNPNCTPTHRPLRDRLSQFARDWEFSKDTDV